MARINLHGILLLDKPQGLTSTGALARVKRLFNAVKAGHTGTLDPMATGLLPLCFGEATKFSTDLLNADKAYEAVLKLGTTTTTGDAEGASLEVRPVSVSEADIEPVLARLRGPIRQVPPMYSALKRDGKPLYEYARAGITLEREAREVSIHRLDLISFADGLMHLSVDCSKGTYIRTLAEDIGAALGCGAHLVSLRRTRVGALLLSDAVTLPQLEALAPDARLAHVLGLDALLSSLPRVDLEEPLAARFCQGQRLQLGVAAGPAGEVRVYGPAGLIGLADRRDDGVLAPSRVIHAGTSPAGPIPAGAIPADATQPLI